MNPAWPSYLTLLETGELARRLREAVDALSDCSHASYPKAPELCLARFDELKKLGLEKFTRKYDPYWDIPLNENLPQPVIDLPIPGEAKEDGGEFRLTGASKPAKRGRSKK